MNPIPPQRPAGLVSDSNQARITGFFDFFIRNWFKLGVLLCIFWIALNIEWVVYTDVNGRTWWRVDQYSGWRP